jgi:hypothetical protein
VGRELDRARAEASGAPRQEVSLRRTLAAALLCVALTVLHTWPVASAPNRLSLNYNADAQLTAWIVCWIAYALPNEPQHVFDGNIFQPERRVLAYSEPLVTPAILGAPIRWLGGSPVLTFNLLMMAGLALTALAGWWVVDRWTGSFAAGIVAGALLAFNSHFLTRLPHLQAMHAWGFPLAFYLTDRLLLGDAKSKREWRTAALLALVLASVAATSVYSFLFVCLMVVIQMLVGARSMRPVLVLAAVGALGIVLSLPVLMLYVRLAAEGVRRTIEDAAPYSATPGGYLTTMARVHASWSRRFATSDVNTLFPGVAAMMFVGSGVFLASVPRRRFWSLIAIAIGGLVLSLGPATPIYRAAYHVFLPLQGVRVPARFGYLPLFSIAILAGYGVAALTHRARSRALSFAIATLALALVTVEAWHGPVPTVPFTGVPTIYTVLDKEPKPVMLVEAPFWHPDVVYGNAEYVLNASDRHAPIMNGYSGFTPDSYRRRAQWFWFFPEQWAIDAMRKEGATHVMVHLEQFGPEAEMVKAGLIKQHGLELIAEDLRGHRLYRFVSTRP